MPDMALALLFPLSVRSSSDVPALMRTMLSIEDDAGSMTFP